MMILIIPVLVEFERVPDGVSMTLWAGSPKDKFRANVNGTNFLFCSNRKERLLQGQFVQGFKAYPEGSMRYQEEDLSLCQEAYLGGSLRLPLEDAEFSVPKTTYRYLSGRKHGPSPQAKP